MTEIQIKNRGWQVAFAGLFINLALGILYTWSVFKAGISESIDLGGEGAFTWDKASLNDPYAICILMFAFSMIFAGKVQDKKGPKITAMIGGLLVALGFIVVSFTTSLTVWVLGFGILTGIGIGFGYSAATPAALKWFPSSKTGLIAGIVVSGFGLAPVYIAPLTSFLIQNHGIHNTMLFFGIGFAVVICLCALFLNNPPKDFVAEKNNEKNKKANTEVAVNFKATEMLKTFKFYVLWIIFFISSGAGLMVIGSISGMAKASMGEAAFAAVAIMAIGNASGRIIAGLVSDKIGKVLTLLIILIFQAILMFSAIALIGPDTAVIIIVVLATLIGFNYGTNLSLFPSFTKSFWGLKNFGGNYGILMSAWGLGGFIFSKLSQELFASTGSHTSSFIIAGASLVFCMGCIFVLTKLQNKNQEIQASE